MLHAYLDALKSARRLATTMLGSRVAANVYALGSTLIARVLMRAATSPAQVMEIKFVGVIGR